MNQVENILFHIDMNRKVCGDKETLDDTQRALTRLLNEYNKLKDQVKAQ